MWTLDVAQLSVSTVDLSPHSKAYFCVIRQLWCGDLIMVWDRCFATTMQQINKREKDGSPARSRWSLTLSHAGSWWLWWPPEASPGLSPAWSAPGTMVIKSVLCATWFLPLSPGRSELDDNSTAPELRLAQTPATDWRGKFMFDNFLFANFCPRPRPARWDTKHISCFYVFSKNEKVEGFGSLWVEGISSICRYYEITILLNNLLVQLALLLLVVNFAFTWLALGTVQAGFEQQEDGKEATAWQSQFSSQDWRAAVWRWVEPLLSFTFNATAAFINSCVATAAL